jgi:hypothetical protein
MDEPEVEPLQETARPFDPECALHLRQLSPPDRPEAQADQSPIIPGRGQLEAMVVEETIREQDLGVDSEILDRIAEDLRITAVAQEIQIRGDERLGSACARGAQGLAARGSAVSGSCHQQNL